MNVFHFHHLSTLCFSTHPWINLLDNPLSFHPHQFSTSYVHVQFSGMRLSYRKVLKAFSEKAYTKKVHKFVNSITQRLIKLWHINLHVINIRKNKGNFKVIHYSWWNRYSFTLKVKTIINYNSSVGVEIS